MPWLVNIIIVSLTAPDTNYTGDMFKEVKDILVEAGQQGPVLLHCGDGRRVGQSNTHSIYMIDNIHYQGSVVAQWSSA